MEGRDDVAGWLSWGIVRVRERGAVVLEKKREVAAPMVWSITESHRTAGGGKTSTAAP